MDPLNLQQLIDILKKPAAHSLELVSRAMEQILLLTEPRELAPIPIQSGDRYEYRNK